MTDYEQLGAFYLGRAFDPEQGVALPENVLYDAKDLTTHAVILGMTGSGKTGLGVALLEEAAIDGIPAIIIDPKGDLANLLLSFPELSPSNFADWVDADAAARRGMTTEEFATDTAQRWREGLAGTGQTPERITRLQEAAEFRVYTPGSEAGHPISVLRSFDAPAPQVLADADALRERVSAAASGLLALLGIDADPVRSREHILLSSILDSQWRAGRGLDLASLIQFVQAPPFERIGIMDLETIFPAGDRLQLALAINNVLASPSFAAWMRGDPLNVQRLLYSESGKPRLSILSIAHLSDSERMFFVTILLNEVLAWMRAQPGTSSLRAMLYMDEVFGYLPPTANPPSKVPLLTLLKQARAFGLGLVLATQNPVDLDYKALSNAGTWFIGRLQTERDKQRLLDGLEGTDAAGAMGFDRKRMEQLISGLGNRVFLLNNVHEDAPLLMQTRWTLSYLRGPLTRKQIRELTFGDDVPPPQPVPHVAAAGSAMPAGALVRPALPDAARETFIAVRRDVPREAELEYRPAILGTGRLHYTDAKSRSGVDVWQTVQRICDAAATLRRDPWDDSEPIDLTEVTQFDKPASGATFAPAAAELERAKSYTGWRSTLKGALYRLQQLELFHSTELKEYSQPGETEGDFRARLQIALREKRDIEREKLRQDYAPKIEKLQDRIRKAEQRVNVEKSQANQATVSAALSVGQTLLGALFGRKLASAGNVSRSATSMRSAGRAAQQRGDIGRAEENVDQLQQELDALEKEFEAELDKARADVQAADIPLEPYPLTPRKSDISAEVSVIWRPFTRDADGATQPAW